jgi:subtilisin-like proprotein convertase family protein
MSSRAGWLIPLLLVASASGLWAAQDERFRAVPSPAEGKRAAARESEGLDDDAWGRRQWFLERMGGELSPEFQQRLVREAEKERARFPHLFPGTGRGPYSPVVSGAWTSLGPTGSTFTENGTVLHKVDSGRTRVILPDPAVADTVYYLTSGGGLWKTTNFTTTATWTPVSDAVGSTAGGAVAFGRASSVLYLGAGDPFDPGIGGFVTKSTDSAGTWGAKVFLGAATKVLDLKVDTSVGTTTSADIVLVGTDAGLFRSADGGATFAAVGGTATAGLSVWTIVKTSAGWLASLQDQNSGAGKLLISTDKGATWAAITNTGSVFTNAGRATLAVGVPGDAIVYCFAANTGDAAQLDLFKSTNGGQAWTALGLAQKIPSSADGDQKDMNLMRTQAFYNQLLLVDPTDANRKTVYLGGSLASAKTTDGGATWTILTDWLAKGTRPYVHADFHTGAVTNLGGVSRVFFGTDGGLFTSTDGGATWDDSKNKGLVTHLVYSLAVQPSIAGSALIGLQDNGTRLRQAAPSLFYDQVRGGDGFGVGWAPASGVSLASYTYNIIRRSTVSPPADQTNFSSFVTGLASQDANNFYFVTPMATPTALADPAGQTFFTYGRVGQIYRSTATGWTQIGAPGAGGLSTGRTIRSVSHGLGVHPADLARIAGAGNQGYVIITTDGGVTWTERLLGPTDSTHPNTVPLVSGWLGFNSNVAWASDKILYVSSEATTAAAPHVARSADGGATWARADTGLPDVPVTKLAVDPGDGTGATVYAATWLGVYRTGDGGASWTRFGSGLPQGRATDLYVAPDSSFLRVGTWGRGVWEVTNVPATGSVSISPTAVVVFPGDKLTFTGAVTGGGSVTWTASGGAVTAAGAYTAPATPGGYTVTATSGANKAVANVVVNTPAPVTITGQPAAGFAADTTTASFSVTATGSGTFAAGYALTYQWKKDGVAIAGATQPNYTTPALSLADNGSVFTCDVTGQTGTVTSSGATLTVQPLGAATNGTSTTVTFLPDNPAPAVEVPFTISGVAGKVGEVTVSMYVTHTYIGDQKITLVAPDGGTVVISANAGGDGVNPSPSGAAFGTSCGNYLVLADKGATSIDKQVAPPAIVGTFKPSFPLGVLAGKAPNGTWKLRFLDGGPGDTGSFQCGVVTVKPLLPSLDLNVDAATDVYDVLEFVRHFGGTAGPDLAKADLNTDGLVNDADLTLLKAGL